MERFQQKDSIDAYAIQCEDCFKWRLIPTKEEFENIRHNFLEEPWYCGRKPNVSCDDPSDLEYDTSRLWVIDKPNIPKPPPKTERMLIMRKDLSRMDALYVMPTGKKVRSGGEVEKFLQTNPEYRDTFNVSDFIFTVPKTDEMVPQILELKASASTNKASAYHSFLSFHQKARRKVIDPQNDTVDVYAIQCEKCFKWRVIPTKEEYETIRHSLLEEPWSCDRKPDVSCDDASDIEYDTSRLWVIDKPNIPKPPPSTQRMVIMRKDFSKMDALYVLPNGKKVRSGGEVEKFLQAYPEYVGQFSVSDFVFTVPKVTDEMVPQKRELVSAKKASARANKKMKMTVFQG